MASRGSRSRSSSSGMTKDLEALSSRNGSTFSMLRFFQTLLNFRLLIFLYLLDLSIAFWFSLSYRIFVSEESNFGTEFQQIHHWYSSTGSTYQPTCDPSYDSTYDPVWNSRREPRHETRDDSALHREYNNFTWKSSNLGSSAVSSSGRSTGNRTSDSMTSRGKSSASDQRPESQVAYGSSDYKDDVRSDKEGESQSHKNSSFPEDQGRRGKGYPRNDRDEIYHRGNPYRWVIIEGVA